MGRIVQADENRSSKLPIIGNIRIGEKIKNAEGKEYPTALDYFKATGDYAVKFNQAYGDKPTIFGIVFHTDNTDQVCNERYEIRDTKTGALVGFGDGVNFKVFNPEKQRGTLKGDYEDFVADTPKKKEELAKLTKKLSNNGEWKAILTLQFIIPKAASVMGLWKFESKGVLSSIPNIRDTFDEVRKLAGTVVNIPFDMHVKKVKSQRPGDKRLYPVVTLIPNVSRDRLDDVRAFLQQGKDIMDIKNFLSTGTPEDGSNEAKALAESADKMKALPQGTGNTLFDQPA